MKYPSIKKVSESRAKSLFLIKKGKPWEKNGFRTLIFQRRKGTINTCLPKKNHYINIFNKWMVSYRNSPKKNVQNGPRLPNANSNWRKSMFREEWSWLLAACCMGHGQKLAQVQRRSHGPAPQKIPSLYFLPVFLLMSARNLYISTFDWLSKSFVPADMLVVFLSLLVVCRSLVDLMPMSIAQIPIL